MRLNRISAVVVAAALGATLAIAPSAVAAPGSGHPAAGVSQVVAALRPHKTVVRVTFAIRVPRSAASPDGRQQEETYSCDWDYGISSSQPIYNKNNQVVAYEVHYGITDQCEIPMFLNALISIKDLNTGKNLGQARQIQPFSENINLDSSARLAVRNHFIAAYALQSTVLPGFVWISTTSPDCFGIGTINLQCFWEQPYNT
jgi:hypothetical protein